MIEPSKLSQPISPKDNNEIVEISSTETDDSDEEEEESIDLCEFPFLREIDAYLNGDLSSGAMESSDSSWVKTETEEDEESTSDNANIQSEPRESPGIARLQNSSEIQFLHHSKEWWVL